jgi:hypothetical protein
MNQEKQKTLVRTHSTSSRQAFFVRKVPKTVRTIASYTDADRQT